MKRIICLIGLFICLNSALAFALPRTWNEYKGERFIIYYKDAPEDMVKSVESMAERYYQEITENLGFFRARTWAWDSRAKIYIYSDADDYIAQSQQASWSSGSASAREKVIRTFPSAHGFFDSTLPHELGHIIFREYVGQDAVLPLWLEEGVAMYQEKAKRWGANKQVKEAMANGTFLNLSELDQLPLYGVTDKSVIELFYAESASVVYYIITEMGESRFVNFCRYLKDGAQFEDAFKRAYVRFKDLNALNEAWIKYLKQ